MDGGGVEEGRGSTGEALTSSSESNLLFAGNSRGKNPTAASLTQHRRSTAPAVRHTVL